MIAPMTAIQRAIEKAGGVRQLADICGVRYQAVQQWQERGRPPVERVLTIERALGISREELRPDIYPVEESASP